VEFWRAALDRMRRRRNPRWTAAPPVTGWWHSFVFPSGETAAGMRGARELQSHLDRFGLPADLRGKRVLDIGAWDGWFSFEMERRGAEVVALDCWDNPRFHYAHRQFQSRVRHVVSDLFELTPASLGRFDIVLFFGVLYHLKHPLLALERVCALSKDIVCVESYVLDPDLRRARRARRDLMEFYETDELGGRADNWLAPNTRCLLSWCRTAGFARAVLHDVADHRAYVTCHRRWGMPEEGAAGAAPELLQAVHNADGGLNFSSRRDEYVSCWFRAPEARPPRRETVQPTVGDWGSAPLSVERKDADVWQCNFKLPPGLDPGIHDVRVRTSGTAFSNALPIAVDTPATAGALAIAGLCDGRSWKPGELSAVPGAVLALWARGVPANADRNNTEVLLDGRRLEIDFVGRASGGEPIQINARVPGGIAGGARAVSIRIGNTISEPAALNVVNAGR
jgi:tRNA (mo5U34)-methyltransferase